MTYVGKVSELVLPRTSYLYTARILILGLLGVERNTTNIVLHIHRKNINM
jgi:hypothetical protein